MDADVVAKSAGRMLDGSFTLDDFLDQLAQVRKMGSMGGLMRLMPGMSKEMRQAADQIDDREVDRVEAIVRSMTKAERADPSVIDGSRRQRIAKGSGRSVQDVNQLLNQFKQMQKMMKSMGGGGKGKGGMARQLLGRGGKMPDSAVDVVSVTIHRMRRKLKPRGLRIVRDEGTGYALDQASRDAIAQLIGA
jgi:signal recognition particle subunit SRP54